MWTYNNTLYHHGILGQKWGDKNGPPYPLGSSNHSTSEKKAGWRKSLDGKNPDKYNRNKQIKKVITNAILLSGAAVAGYYLYKSAQNNYTFEANLKGFDIPNYVNGILGGYADFKINDFPRPNKQSINDEIDNIIKTDTVNNSDNTNSGNYTEFRNVAQKEGFKVDDTFEVNEKNLGECMDGINRERSRTNCGSCAVASVLRFMGIDAKSLNETPENMKLTPEHKGFDPDKIADCFDGAFNITLADATGTTYLDRRIEHKDRAYKALCKQLLKQGDGACGLVYTGHLYNKIDELNADPEGYSNPKYWSKTGHYQAYIVLNGKVYFADGQAGYRNVYSQNEIDGKMMDRIDPKSIGWIRLDGHPPKTGKLKNVVQPR